MSNKVKLEIIESDSNYVATIVKLPELKKVDWLDNLMIATQYGYNCLVGKDSDKDVPYVFFPAECVLSPEFLHVNNLYRKSELNIDKEKKGFFEESGRVKAVKFKGIVSSGFLIPVMSLWGDVNEVSVGDTFHNINWRKICWKYRRPCVSTEQLTKQQRISKRLDKFDIVIPNQFRFHGDTPQFLRFIDDFREGDRIIITEKLHGTSAVFSNVLVQRPITKMEKFSRLFWVRIQDKEYYHLYSSRTVIKNDDLRDPRNVGNGYYWEDLWGMYAKQLESKIEKGITIYGEIVGYTPSGAYIQKGYHYGCKEWESKFYVYRMTYTTPDGVVIEFTDSQIRQYAKQREIDVVPLISETSWSYIPQENERLIDFLKLDVEKIDRRNTDNAPREGVVIRRDGQETYSAYKLKSQLFLWYETAQIDAGTEDTEEAN